MFSENIINFSEVLKIKNITPACHCIQNIVFECIQQVEQLQDEGVRHGPCPSESTGLSSPCAFSGNEYGQDDKDGKMVKL